MLRYTGHPFVDVGVATICAFAGVDEPQDLSDTHLEAFAHYARDLYLNRVMLGYLSFVVFPNIINPATLENPKFEAQRRKIIYELFDVWRWEPGLPLPEKETLASANEKCVFSGELAVLRVSQNVVPMVGGASTVNFFPEGQPKLPISKWCVLALLALPLGTLNSSGKTFLVHSHNPKILRALAELNFKRNQQAMALAEGLDKRPNYVFPKTTLIQDLISIETKTNQQNSITAYLFVSGGQNPSIQIIHLPSVVINFMAIASKLEPTAWREVVKRAWERENNKSKKTENQREPTYTDRNFFYEDLFDLPQDSIRFLRRYLLRQPLSGKVHKSDPRYSYSFIHEREVISWNLIALFTERVMNMDKERLEAIKNLADRLAEYIQDADPRLFKNLYLARNDYQMRRELLIAANKAKGSYHNTLLPYDEFIEVFFIDEGDAVKPDWYLARDLLLIRIIERLSEEWLQVHANSLIEVTEESTEQDSAK